jgi:polyisoprenoid-binding protein YceI
VKEIEMSNLSTAPVTRTVEGNEIPAAGTYAIDASHSEVGFSVRHLMVSKTRGRFSDVSGTVSIGDDPLASSVEVTIGTASIDTRDDTRDAHLRSPDFFDVEQYPSMTYRSTKVVPAGKGKWLVEGDLSLHGVTRNVPLEVSFEGAAVDPSGGVRAGFSARAELDREDFGLTWNYALETGGVVVGKKVTIEIEAETVHQA